jgi:hypothetical protein
MDNRLIGKILQLEGGVGSDKLMASPAFIENLSSTGSVLATVRVSKPDYVPGKLHVRMRISPTLFTATVSKDDLVNVLKDALVLAVQPSQPLHSGDKI